MTRFPNVVGGAGQRALGGSETPPPHALNSASNAPASTTRLRIPNEMRSRVVLAGALLALLSACGGGVSDPPSARCPAPPTTFGKRVIRSNHAETAVHYRCERSE